MTSDEFQFHVVDALARLDTKMATLVGNGQPGRISILEVQVEALKRARWIAGGVITGITIVVSALIHFVFKY
jgi:hypothetical protein